MEVDTGASVSLSSKASGPLDNYKPPLYAYVNTRMNLYQSWEKLHDVKVYVMYESQVVTLFKH